MYIDYFLKFESEAQAKAVLFRANMRLSAVLTATSAPPDRLVRFAVPGTAPGVLLLFNSIVGMD